jgi:hypothetical protein
MFAKPNGARGVVYTPVFLPLKKFIDMAGKKECGKCYLTESHY